MNRPAELPHPTPQPKGAGWPAPVADLTPRQTEVLRLVAEGLSNREIAKRLVISPATVENHLHAIFGRLGVRTRTEAAVLAVMAGVLALPSEDEGSPLLPFEEDIR